MFQSRRILSLCVLLLRDAVTTAVMPYTLYVGFTTGVYIRVAKQRSEGRLR